MSLLRIFLVLDLVLVACGASSLSPNDDPIPTGPEMPVLENLGVAFAPYDPATGRAGAFRFDPSLEKVFLEFGAVVRDPQGRSKVLPTFEYIVAPDVAVLAVADGIVTGVRFQPETDDVEIWIRRTSTSPILVVQDHIRDPTVRVGDRVEAGQRLGRPGPWGEGFGRTEIMVVDEERAYAPFAFFLPSASKAYQKRVSRLMREWEAFKGDPTLYDEARMSRFYAGCLARSYANE